jgi:PAS domain S-box-containing protein
MTFSLLAVGILPALLFSLIVVPSFKYHLHDDIGSLTQALLSAISSQTSERALAGPRRSLPTILLLADPKDDQARDRELLKAMLTPSPEYERFFILDSREGIISTYPDAGASLGSSYRLKGSRALGETVFSSPFVSEYSGHFVVEASYSTADRSAVVLINLDWLSSHLVLFARSPGDRLAVVDAQGRLILSNDPSRVQRGEALPAEALRDGPEIIAEDSRKYYVSSMPIPGSSWRAVYYRPREEALAPLVSVVRRLVMLCLAALSCSLAASLFVWKALSASLSRLLSRIARISEGHYEERVGEDSVSEFREIGDAFNAMAESIQRRDRRILESETRYRLLFNDNKAPALLADGESGAICDANAAALEFYGYDGPEMLNLHIWDIATPNEGEFPGALIAASEREFGGVPARHRLKSGEGRDAELYVGRVEVDGKCFMHCVLFDVTQQKVAERRLRSALEEKDLLIREVYHRVKNNLQIISSLLHMQEEQSRDPAVLAALSAGQSRVYAMALAHELVYQVSDLSSIDIADYAGRLVAYLADSYGLDRSLIRLELEPISLQLERSLPFGLLLNEAISNAMKYARPADEGEAILVLAYRLSPDEVELVVEDHGPGMSLERPDAGRPTLGLSLVKALAEQLSGTVSWGAGADGRGVRMALRFPMAGDL